MEGVNSFLRIIVKCQKQPSANISGVEFLRINLSMLLIRSRYIYYPKEFHRVYELIFST